MACPSVMEMSSPSVGYSFNEGEMRASLRLCLKRQRARRARGGKLCSKAFEADVAAATAMQNNAAAEIIRPRAVREEFSNRA